MTNKYSILFSVFFVVFGLFATGINGEQVKEIDNKFWLPGISITIDQPGTSTPPPTSETTTQSAQTTPMPTAPTQNPNDCPRLNGLFPCFKIPTGCVCVIKTQKPWVDAYDFCKSNGRSLISFNTAEKQTELETYLPSIIAKSDSLFTTIGFWTSGTFCLETSIDNIYCPSKNTWAWAATRLNFGFVNWEVGQPDTISTPGSYQQCARVVPTDKYRWDDIDCGQFLPFICE